MIAIFARLTKKDWRAFEARPFSHSGRTGPCDPALYPAGIAPYIATTDDAIAIGIECLGWKAARIDVRDGQLIVTRAYSTVGSRRTKELK